MISFGTVIFWLISATVIYNYALNFSSPLMVLIATFFLFFSCQLFVCGLKKFIKEMKGDNNGRN